MIYYIKENYPLLYKFLSDNNFDVWTARNEDCRYMIHDKRNEHKRFGSHRDDDYCVGFHYGIDGGAFSWSGYKPNQYLDENEFVKKLKEIQNSRVRNIGFSHAFHSIEETPAIKQDRIRLSLDAFDEIVNLEI